MNLLHWHGQPSKYQEPPACCQSVALMAVDRAIEDATHSERRRVVTESLRELDSYRASVASVVEPDALKLIDRVLGAVTGIVRGVGCICPMVDVSALGEMPGSRMVPGGDPRCGVHGEMAKGEAA